MKYIYRLIPLFIFTYSNIFGQCSNFDTQYPTATQSTTSNTLVNATTCAFGGDYGVYEVTNGETYTWTTCGDLEFDTQLTLTDNTQTNDLAFNDNDCGLQSTITWTATFTGQVHVLVSEFNCSSNSDCMTVEWACTSCGSGGGSGCVNTSSFGSASAPTDPTPVVISSCNYQTEYSTISNVVAGETYEVNSDCGGFVTVRSGTYNGTVVASGNAPLSWTATSNDDHYIHWNTNSSCGTATDCCETNITCTSCPILPPTQQDCEGAQIVCNNNSFSGNSDGSGNYDDLDSDNQGCLSGENESSWYYVNIGTGGTLEMSINPEQADDYDFAIWGPYTETNADDNCPPIEDPRRCSWAAGAGETGLGNGATDFSEGAGGDDWVAPINTTTGDIYILLIDNFSETNDPFDLNWGGSAVLDCTPVNLPVELLDFTVSNQKRFNLLEWETSSEKNNDYFQIEHSIDGKNWSSIGNVQGAGSTLSEQAYTLTHSKFFREINYYRLKQIDYDGTTTDHGIISIDNRNDVKLVKRVNALGQEVDESYKGVVFEYYSDGSTVKKMQW